MKILALIILTVALCHRQNEANATTIYVRDAQIDVCFATRTLAVFIEVDPIAVSDSLLGFDVSLTFNPDHVVFDRLLTLGTIGGGLEWEPEGNFTRPGVANVQGFNISEFLRSSERTPLIGFVGRLLGDCPEEVILEVAAASFAKLESDGVRTTDVPATIDGLGKLSAIEGEADERKVALSFAQTQEVVFAKGENNLSNVQISFARGDETRQASVDYEILIEPEGLFAIEAIRSLDKGIDVEDVAIDNSGNQARFVCDFSGNQELEIAEFLDIELRNVLNKDTTANLVLRPIQAETCSCIKELLGSSLILRSQEKITTRVSDGEYYSTAKFEGLTVQTLTDEWLIENRNEVEQIETVVVYDVIGQIVLQLRADFGRRWVKVPHGHLSAGVYLAHVTSKTGNYIVLNMSK